MCVLCVGFLRALFLVDSVMFVSPLLVYPTLCPSLHLHLHVFCVAILPESVYCCVLMLIFVIGLFYVCQMVHFLYLCLLPVSIFVSCFPVLVDVSVAILYSCSSQSISVSWLLSVFDFSAFATLLFIHVCMCPLCLFIFFISPHLLSLVAPLQKGKRNLIHTCF